MTQPIPPSRVLSSRVLETRADVKGAGGWACLAFAAVLGAAFWLGALFASHPFPH